MIHMIQKLGVQLYTIRDTMKTAEEIRSSFFKLKELGYDEAQTAGCAISYADFGKIAAETGIRLVGTHDSFDAMVADIDAVMENHRLLGTTNIGVGGMPGKYWESLETIKAFIALVNQIADRIHPCGFKFTYHNHSSEFRKFDGKRIMDLLAEELDPVKTSFVLDTYWVQHGGGDVRQWMEKLAGRIDILHLKDMGRNETGPYYTEILNGNLNFDGIMETAEKIGVKHYVVEQDTCPGDPFASLKLSSDNIHQRFMQRA